MSQSFSEVLNYIIEKRYTGIIESSSSWTKIKSNVSILKIFSLVQFINLSVLGAKTISGAAQGFFFYYSYWFHLQSFFCVHNYQRLK